MFAIQTAIKYIGRYIFPGILVLVTAVTSATAYHIGNAGLSNITAVDTIELTCGININESDEINLYKLTAVGYLGTGNIHSEKVPPAVSQSFDLITNGTIESIENIVLSVYINGGLEAVKYDIAYAVLEEVDMGGRFVISFAKYDCERLELLQAYCLSCAG